MPLEDLYRLEPMIAGDRLPIPIGEFCRSCHALVAEEQAKVDPDNALIGVLCNAVRLAREVAANV